MKSEVSLSRRASQPNMAQVQRWQLLSFGPCLSWGDAMAWGLYTFIILYMICCNHSGLASQRFKNTSTQLVSNDLFVLRHPLPNFQRPCGSKRYKIFVGTTSNGQDKRTGRQVDPRAAAQQAKFWWVFRGGLDVCVWSSQIDKRQVSS